MSGLRGESRRDYEIAFEAMKLTNTLHLAERPFNELGSGDGEEGISRGDKGWPVGR